MCVSKWVCKHGSTCVNGSVWTEELMCTWACKRVMCGWKSVWVCEQVCECVTDYRELPIWALFWIRLCSSINSGNPERLRYPGEKQEALQFRNCPWHWGSGWGFSRVPCDEQSILKTGVMWERWEEGMPGFRRPGGGRSRKSLETLGLGLCCPWSHCHLVILADPNLQADQTSPVCLKAQDEGKQESALSGSHRQERPSHRLLSEEFIWKC